MCRRVRRVIPGMVPSHRRPCGMRKTINLTRAEDTTALSLIRGRGKRKVKLEEKKGQDAEMEGRISQTPAVLAQHQCSPNRAYLARSPTPASTGARDLRLPSFAASRPRARRCWSATRLASRASSEKPTEAVRPLDSAHPSRTKADVAANTCASGSISPLHHRIGTFNSPNSIRLAFRAGSAISVFPSC